MDKNAFLNLRGRIKNFRGQSSLPKSPGKNTEHSNIANDILSRPELLPVDQKTGRQTDLDRQMQTHTLYLGYSVVT